MREMKTPNTKTKRVSLIALAVVIACVCIVSRRAAGAEDKLDFLAFGVVGITPGQTVRLHAVSVGVPDVQNVELMFFDSQGNLLGHSFERLLPGRAASLDFTPIDVRFNRMEIYSVMRFVNGSPRRGYVIPTAEVIDDSTGKTIFMSGDPTG
jgi:hypothetical protein